jgi:hypothetical protein
VSEVFVNVGLVLGVNPETLRPCGGSLGVLADFGVRWLS